MNVLGIRCSNTDFAYAVMTGEKDEPDLLKSEVITFPKGYKTPEKLKWLLHELETLNAKYQIDSWAIKGAEPMASKGKAYAERVEFEAMVGLSAANAGKTQVLRKVKSTIAKDLGLPGKAKSLVNDLDYSLVEGLEDMCDKEFEAVVVAWSELV